MDMKKVKTSDKNKISFFPEEGERKFTLRNNVQDLYLNHRISMRFLNEQEDVEERFSDIPLKMHICIVRRGLGMGERLFILLAK